MRWVRRTELSGVDPDGVDEDGLSNRWKKLDCDTSDIFDTIFRQIDADLHGPRRKLRRLYRDTHDCL